jgi:tetratricopeptide (TPR) repeat protein
LWYETVDNRLLDKASMDAPRTSLTDNELKALAAIQLSQQASTQKQMSAGPVGSGSPELQRGVGKRSRSPSLLIVVCLCGITLLILNSLIWRNTGKANIELAHQFYKQGNYPLAVLEFENAIAAGIKTSDVFAWKATAELRAGQFDLAAEDFGKAAAIDPQNVAYLLGRAQAQLKDGKFRPAIADATRALKLRATDMDARRIRAAAYAYDNQFENSITDLNDGATHFGVHAEALAIRAYSLFKAGRIREALADYDSAIAMSPNNSDLLADRALVLLEAKQPAKALQSCQAAIEKAGKKPVLISLSARCKMMAGDKAGAIKDMEIASRTDAPLEVLKECVETSLKLGCEPLAYDYLRRITEIAPGDTSSIEKRDKIAACLKSKHIPIIAAGSEPSSKAPIRMDLLNKLSSSELAFKGYELYKSGAITDSMTVLAESLKKDPNNSEARRLIVFALLAQGASADAAREVSNLRHSPGLDQRELLAFAGEFKNHGQFNYAGGIYEEILTENRDHFEARIGLIECCLGKGDSQRATQLVNSGLDRRLTAEQRKVLEGYAQPDKYKHKPNSTDERS